MDSSEVKAVVHKAREVLDGMASRLKSYAAKPDAKSDWVQQRGQELSALGDLYRMGHKPIVIIETQDDAYRRGFAAGRKQRATDYTRGVNDGLRQITQPSPLHKSFMGDGERERFRHQHNDQQREKWADHH